MRKVVAIDLGTVYGYAQHITEQRRVGSQARAIAPTWRGCVFIT
jgi:hypothetical protein